MIHAQERYISGILSDELLRFCKENDLPFNDAAELVMRKDLTDFQFGWLIAFNRMWDGLIK